MDAKQNNCFFSQMQFRNAKERIKNYRITAEGRRTDDGTDMSSNGDDDAAADDDNNDDNDDDTNIVEMSIDSKHRKGGIVLFELI